MKQITAALAALLVALTLAGCNFQAASPESTTPPSPAQTEPSLPLRAGWHTIDGNRYCISPQGTPHTGWLTDTGKRYYLTQEGMALTGWQTIEGKRFYFDGEGAMVTGWTLLEGERYYFGIDGSMITGLMNIEGKVYYFGGSGVLHTGWLTLADRTYYFDSQGMMAVGEQEIEGITHHFSPHGVKILLVNPWNPLPQDHTVDLAEISEADKMSVLCADALLEMLADCEAAGFSPWVVSGYRTQEEQEYLYNRKVEYYLELEWKLEEARKEAAKSVAIPGTSEHQLGLAVDILDRNVIYMDERQAKTGTQKWLMEHCHEYGFILRYPVGTTDITGIIYEPWHYRYVGLEIAQEITNLGITLEEYLGAV